MQVAVRSEQHDVLIEAVQNHNPNVIVIDEIGTKAEVNAGSFRPIVMCRSANDCATRCCDGGYCPRCVFAILDEKS